MTAGRMNIPELNSTATFERFFREHHGQMVSYAGKFVDDSETAKDIVQEVFLKTWENRKKIEINTSLKTYLFAAIRNRCINFFRHKGIQQQFEDETQAGFRELELNYFASEEEQHMLIYEKETSDKIQETIRSLPEKCRRIFELSRFGGLKSPEIAKQLDISVRTVETQIYRALKELKDKLIKKELKDKLIKK
jgi:RNA polymerase sigma-70 factor (ECF subfamily)